MSEPWANGAVRGTGRDIGWTGRAIGWTGRCGRDDVERQEKTSGEAELRQRARRKNPAHDGITEGGKGRPDGPLPCQTQHTADHTRPKSMWSRVTKRCWAFMRLLEQHIRTPVKRLPHTGPP
ncbi:hypothetical protein GCM10009549_16910 [Streptomyces thermoalcalitolerans]|uniref:Uncharacterized protein n=1 Tax=Streptomyces thermoalcalitolerans TaxID=65605 RepID=A0ABN1NI61_9ACTN